VINELARFCSFSLDAKRIGEGAVKKSAAVEVVVVDSVSQIQRFDKMMGEEHYLRSSAPVGDFLRQVGARDGEWVGLLAWGACSYALQDRDEWIGWTRPLRARRQKLIVQNRWRLGQRRCVAHSETQRNDRHRCRRRLSLPGP